VKNLSAAPAPLAADFALCGRLSYDIPLDSTFLGKICCAEVVHILSSDDEDDKAVTSAVTCPTLSTVSTSSSATTLPFRVCQSHCNNVN